MDMQGEHGLNSSLGGVVGRRERAKLTVIKRPQFSKQDDLTLKLPGPYAGMGGFLTVTVA